jgi:hypothetical protein
MSSLIDYCDDTLTDKNSFHSYLSVYEQLFHSKRNTATDILEIGIGPTFPTNGGSMIMWSKYFTHATIHAFDILPIEQINTAIVGHPRIHLYPSSDAYDVHGHIEQFHEANMMFDIMIDDGPHTLQSMIFFLKHYSKLLKDDGILVIEDIQDMSWIDILRDNTPHRLRPFIEVYDVRHVKGRYDDVLFVIRKSESKACEQ